MALAQRPHPGPRRRPAVLDAAVLVAARRVPPIVPRREQAPFAPLLANALERRGTPIVQALAPIFSKRQLHRLLR